VDKILIFADLKWWRLKQTESQFCFNPLMHEVAKMMT